MAEVREEMRRGQAGRWRPGDEAGHGGGSPGEGEQGGGARARVGDGGGSGERGGRRG